MATVQAAGTKKLVNADQIVIRKCHSLEEMRSCVALQKEVWNFSDIELVPLRLFVVADKVGGQVIGAFDDLSMVSFALAIPGSRGGRSYLHSHMGEISRTLSSEETLCVLDLGATSPNNIRYFTDRGHKPYSEDVLLSSIDPALVTKDDEGNRVMDERRFLAENLVYPAAHFDVIFCWNLPDYMRQGLAAGRKGAVIPQDVWILGADRIERYSCG